MDHQRKHQRQHARDNHQRCRSCRLWQARDCIEPESFRHVRRQRAFLGDDATRRGRRHIDRDETRVGAHEVMSERDGDHVASDFIGRRAVALRIHQRFDLVAGPQDTDPRFTACDVER